MTYRFKFTTDEEVCCYSDGDFYALCNSYADAAVEALESEEDQKKVWEACELLEAFFDQARDAGIIGEM